MSLRPAAPSPAPAGSAGPAGGAPGAPAGSFTPAVMSRTPGSEVSTACQRSRGGPGSCPRGPRLRGCIAPLAGRLQNHAATRRPVSPQGKFVFASATLSIGSQPLRPEKKATAWGGSAVRPSCALPAPYPVCRRRGSSTEYRRCTTCRRSARRSEVESLRELQAADAAVRRGRREAASSCSAPIVAAWTSTAPENQVLSALQSARRGNAVRRGKPENSARIGRSAAASITSAPATLPPAAAAAPSP
jgi:hypothetical protein